MPRSKRPATKSAFIRAQPVTMSVGQVVSAGKEAGFDVTRATVHRVRWQERQKRLAGRATKSKSPGRVSRAPERAYRARDPVEVVGREDADLLWHGLARLIRTIVRRELRSMLASDAE